MFSEILLSFSISFPLMIIVRKYFAIKTVIKHIKLLQNYKFFEKSEQKQSIKELIKLSHLKSKFLYGGLNSDIYREVTELHIFAPTRKVFKQLIESNTFSVFFEPYTLWLSELYKKREKLYRVLLIIVSLTIVLLFLFIYIVDSTNKNILQNQFYIELIGSLIQLLGICFIYYFVVSPFIQTKKIKHFLAQLSYRNQSDYYSKKGYEYIFLIGLLGYICSSVYYDMIPSVSVIFAFIHLLLLGIFSESIVEKGSPFSGENALERTANIGVLLTQHSLLSGFSLFIIYLHWLFSSKYYQYISHDISSYYTLEFIFIILLFQWISNWFAKQRLTKSFFKEYQLVINSEGK